MSVAPGRAEAERTAVGAGRPHDTRQVDVETASESYAARFAGPAGRWMLEVQARAVLELLAGAAPGPLNVLEVGGGHGQLTGPLRRAGHRVMVQGSRTVCHARGRCAEPRVGRVVSDLWELPFPDAAFDAVVGVRLLAHAEAWRELLTEMARVTRRVLLVDFPVRSGPHALAPRLFSAKRRLEGSTRPYFDYTAAEVSRGLAAAGLATTGVVRQFALPMVLHRTLGTPRLSRGLERLARATGITERSGSPVLLRAEPRASGPAALREELR